MPENQIRVHSLAEAHLYLLVTPCGMCRHGSVDPSIPQETSCSGIVRFTATCGNCAGTCEYFFATDDKPKPVDPLSDCTPINDSPEPSEVIDVAQWITLYNMLLEAGGSTPDAAEQRWLKFRAAQCLDEALKFYVADNEVPPETAFHTGQSKHAYRDHPQRFARSRLLSLRSKLPKVGVEVGVMSGRRTEKPWWKFWSK